MSYYVQYWDERDRRCASYDTVTSVGAGRELWNTIRDFEPGAYDAVILNEFGDRVVSLGI